MHCFQKPCVPNRFVGVHFTLCMQFVAPCYSLLIAIKIYSNSTVIYWSSTNILIQILDLWSQNTFPLQTSITIAIWLFKNLGDVTSLMLFTNKQNLTAYHNLFLGLNSRLASYSTLALLTFFWQENEFNIGVLCAYIPVMNQTTTYILNVFSWQKNVNNARGLQGAFENTALERLGQVLYEVVYMRSESSCFDRECSTGKTDLLILAIEDRQACILLLLVFRQLNRYICICAEVSAKNCFRSCSVLYIYLMDWVP